MHESTPYQSIIILILPSKVKLFDQSLSLRKDNFSGLNGRLSGPFSAGKSGKRDLKKLHRKGISGNDFWQTKGRFSDRENRKNGRNPTKS